MSRSPDVQPWGPRAGAATGRIIYQPRAPRPADSPGAPGRANAECRQLPAVATVLAPDERLRVDAAGLGLFHALHQDSLDALAAMLRGGPVGAVVVAAPRAGDRGGARWVARLVELVREFPAVPAVALVSEDVDLAVVFALGRGGLRAVVDVRRPDGWGALRTVLAAAARPDVAQLAAEILGPQLTDLPADVQRFVTVLFEAPTGMGTVREFARGLGVLPTTLMSRFFRARLPAPKRYLAFARLARAADLLANPSWTVASVADYLEYSSAQGFSRHLYLLLGVRPAEFRRRFTPRVMVERFGEELIAPYRAELGRLRPLGRE